MICTSLYLFSVLFTHGTLSASLNKHVNYQIDDFIKQLMTSEKFTELADIIAERAVKRIKTAEQTNTKHSYNIHKHVSKELHAPAETTSEKKIGRSGNTKDNGKKFGEIDMKAFLKHDSKEHSLNYKHLKKKLTENDKNEDSDNESKSKVNAENVSSVNKKIETTAQEIADYSDNSDNPKENSSKNIQMKSKFKQKDTERSKHIAVIKDIEADWNVSVNYPGKNSSHEYIDDVESSSSEDKSVDNHQMSPGPAHDEIDDFSSDTSKGEEHEANDRKSEDHVKNDKELDEIGKEDSTNREISLENETNDFKSNEEVKSVSQDNLINAYTRVMSTDDFTNYEKLLENERDGNKREYSTKYDISKENNNYKYVSKEIVEVGINTFNEKSHEFGGKLENENDMPTGNKRRENGKIYTYLSSPDYAEYHENAGRNFINM